MSQSRDEANKLMEQQHYPPDYKDDDNEIELDPESSYCFHVCICGHLQEEHIQHEAECCECECTYFEEEEE